MMWSRKTAGFFYRHAGPILLASSCCAVLSIVSSTIALLTADEPKLASDLSFIVSNFAFLYAIHRVWSNVLELRKDIQEQTAFMADTVLNREWMKANQDAVKALLPETWTHIGNVDIEQIAIGLKELGVQWTTIQGAANSVFALEANGTLLREGDSLKRTPKIIA